MNIYESKDIKNIAIVGSSESGKTTLSEAMLLEGEVIKRRGTVEDKNTASDFHPVEHDYGYSVFPSVLYTEWKGKKLNFIDTPGSDDFVGGVISALNVADTGIMVLNSRNGMEVGTETLSRHAEKLNKPLIFAVNQLDHENANFIQTIEQAKEIYKNKIVLIQYPVNVGEDFNQVVDVLKMEMYEWGPEGGKPKVLPIPDSEKEKANELHNTLVESAAENDEALMELYFEKGSLTESEMREGIKKGLINRDMFPVFCISSLKDMCVRRLMEFIVNVCPSADEMPASITTEGEEIPYDSSLPTSLFVFNTTIEQHLGEINIFKVASGTLKEGDDLLNMTTNTKERISQLYQVAGKNRIKVSSLKAGDIGATVKLKNTKNNHTLNSKGANYQFNAIKYPEPKFRSAIKAVDEHEEEHLAEVMSRIQQEDPSIKVEYSKELKQTIVYGQGEFHINTLKWRIANNDKIDIELFSPRIPYRETITSMASANYRHKKQSGGSGQFGEVHLLIEPLYEGIPEPDTYHVNGKELKVKVREKEEVQLPWGGNLQFYNCIVGGVIDTRFMPAILKGIMEKMEEGPLTGSYARDIRVCIYDGKMHAVDSNEISFKLAGRHAFSDAFRNAKPKILEPVYDINILVPESKMGDVMSDLQTRRALILGMEANKGFQNLKAKIPLKEVDKYSTILSSITGGRATFNMAFSEYSPVNSDIQKELLEDYMANHSEEE
ncbi:MAG: elongation factor G [Marinifilaceae bacterium]|jgi:elongation factor G|nr:elongation factor G [Marinifilaceae bacterium]